MRLQTAEATRDYHLEGLLQITVKGKNFDVTEALKSHATQKVGKMSRYSDAVITAEVTLATERNWHVAEVTLFGKGFDMHIEEKSKDMYNSIDRVVERLERQLKKQREKVANHRSGRGEGIKVESGEQEAPKQQPNRDGDPYSTDIESVYHFIPQTMTVAAAIKEMEAEDFEFLCFNKEDDGKLCIVHKKGRGYGLLVPNLED